jgi:hypothetical protein
VADIRFSKRAQQSVADGMHQGVRVRMTIESLGVRDFHASEHKLAPFHQGVNIIAYSDMHHCGTIGASGCTTKDFSSGVK